MDRRAFFQNSGLGLGAAALGTLLNESTGAVAFCKGGASGLHHAASAKSIVYLHMIGAPSQLDLFDPKPELVRRDNEVCPPSLLEGRRFAFIGGELRLSGSTQKFKQHGQSGHSISNLMPNLAKVADGKRSTMLLRSCFCIQALDVVGDRASVRG